MKPVESQQLQELRDSVAHWARVWGIPRLGKDVALRISPRFRRSLGNFRAQRVEITLASWLVDGPAKLLEEVLCHEAAHAAVHFVYGGRVTPHGAEWRGFMAQAALPARVRIPLSELPESRQSSGVNSSVWEHRCPVCQAARLAKTRVTRWRCRRCRDQGRAGELVIERVPSPMAVDG